MSRIGKQSIEVPQKVKIKLEKQKIFVEGPKGSLFRILPSVICCTLDEENNKSHWCNQKWSQSFEIDIRQRFG